MSVTLGKRLMTDVCQKSFFKFRSRRIVFKSKSTSAAKQSSPEVIPVPEPGKIHAAVLCDFSSPLVVRNIDEPKCTKPNEVVIDVQYCAINASDVLLSKNLHYWEPKIPMVLGYELMGKVAEVGEEAQKSGYQVGDRVVALNKDLYGGLAERCIAEIGDVWKIPADVKGVDAVCLFDNYMTALLALERQVSINEDDMIVVNVGVSGIGLAAVDLATNVYRAKVIGISATEDGASLIRDKGAFASLKFQERKLLKHIEELAADRNITAIFDGVGGEYFKKILNCFTDIYKEGTTMKDMLCNDNFAVVVHHLSREGRVIVAGTAISNMKSHTEVHQGTFSVTGFNLRAYRKKDPEAYRLAGDEVLQFFEEGLITPSCSLIAGLYKVNTALKYAYDMKSSGKVVIDIRNKDADATENKQNQ